LSTILPLNPPSGKLPNADDAAPADASAIWLALLAAVVSGFVVLLERQNRTLQLLLERTEPTTAKPSARRTIP